MPLGSCSLISFRFIIYRSKKSSHILRLIKTPIKETQNQLRGELKDADLDH